MCHKGIDLSLPSTAKIQPRTPLKWIQKVQKNLRQNNFLSELSFFKWPKVFERSAHNAESGQVVNFLFSMNKNGLNDHARINSMGLWAATAVTAGCQVFHLLSSIWTLSLNCTELVL